MILSTHRGFDYSRVLKHPLFILACVVAICLFMSHSAWASDAGSGGGGAGLPWEEPIAKLRKSISGPVAFAVSLLGLIATGCTLIWGGEIGEFARKMVYVVLVIALIVFANTLLTGTMFSGAVLPADASDAEWVKFVVRCFLPSTSLLIP
ncbi:TrbC/VirB2 family protein [Xanthomonas perforans]|uniref:TrbC/VirB2 family protein n=1 Tax=Xanthomonas perforans TaxID=442694 RepID=UPI002359ABCF|nr:TrbC/VirB2 family protein [Xanthomonas perforans]MDC9654352.1 TrbC/VirB2 family protein [Xanthomonas perforans]MEB2158968.1 TrbC/VirB2 family protein [Xanthomonas campestris pv. campestris]